MRATLFFLLEVLLLYFLPLFAMGRNPTLLTLRPYFFALGGIYILLQALRARVSLRSWGITRTHIFSASLALLPLTLLLPLGAYLILQFVSPQARLWLIGYDMLSYSLPTRLLLYIFASVPIQELIFRSYLVWRLERLAYSPRLIIALSTFLFVLGHVPFRSPIMIIVSLFMGYSYARLYQRARSLYPLIFSHALAGSLLMIVRNYFLPY